MVGDLLFDLVGELLSRLLEGVGDAAADCVRAWRRRRDDRRIRLAIRSGRPARVPVRLRPGSGSRSRWRRAAFVVDPGAPSWRLQSRCGVPGRPQSWSLDRPAVLVATWTPRRRRRAVTVTDAGGQELVLAGSRRALLLLSSLQVLDGSPLSAPGGRPRRPWSGRGRHRATM